MPRTTTMRAWYHLWSLLTKLAWGLAGLVALLLVANLAFYAYYSIQVNREVAVLRQAGEAVTPAEITLAPVSPDQDAWPDYAALLRIPSDTPYARVWQLQSLGTLGRGEVRAVLDAGGGPARAPQAREVLASPAGRQAVAVLNRAAAKPHLALRLPIAEERHCGGQPWSALLAVVGVCADAAKLAAAEGQMTAAGDYLLAGVGLARQTLGNPQWIAQGVTVAMLGRLTSASQAVLRQGPLPLRQSRLLRVELARLEPRPALRRALIAERAYALASLRSCAWSWRRARVMSLSYNRAPLVHRLARFSPAYWKRQEMLAFAVFGEALEAAAGSPGATARGARPTNAHGRVPFDLAREWEGPLTDFGRDLPWYYTGPTISAVALALSDYHAQHGRYPASLAVLGAIPADPCSGRPFGYRRQNGTFVLYSAGLDGQDDGGTPQALASPREPGDIVWAVALSR